MKACIIYLVKSHIDYVHDFINSLHSVNTYFAKNHNYPIEVFVEPSFTYTDYVMGKIPKQLNIRFNTIKFPNPQNIYPKLDIPEFFPHPTHGNGPIGYGHLGFDIGYRHMCNFFSGDMYNNIILDDYDYYMRLDTDSVFTDYIDDIFVDMHKNNVDYGYVRTDKDHDKVIEGLWELSEKYRTINNIESPLPPKPGMYYTNFELGRISFFRDPNKYMRYYNFIKDSGGIYTNRWGDAPIKYIGVQLHTTKIKQYKIGYHHGTVKPSDSIIKKHK